jgi:hypothetical protein
MIEKRKNFPYLDKVMGYATLQAVRDVDALLAEVRALREEYEKARKLLCECASDIYQTARVNQGNINGVDPIFANDKPCVEWIGHHFVHQYGVDVSLLLVNKILAFVNKDAAQGKEE